MISNIKQCSYTADTNYPLQPLHNGQLDLLQRTKAQDISGVVGRIVEVYFNYMGNEIYRVRLQKERITFDINGDHRELRLHKGRWELITTQGITALADQTRISADITCALERIRHAYQTTEPSPSPFLNTDHPSPYHSSYNFEPPFRNRNTLFESQNTQMNLLQSTQNETIQLFRAKQQKDEALLAKQAQQITDLQQSLERLNQQLAAERAAIELAFQ